MRTLILTLTLLFTLTAQSQSKREMIQALKVAHITDALDLTEAEAQQFWPIYKDYEKTMKSLRKQRMRPQELSTLNNTEAETFVNKMLEDELKRYNAKKNLITKLKAFLPAIKLIKLQIAEEEFRHKLLKELRERRKRH